jgi:hypothetical protein
LIYSGLTSVIPTQDIAKARKHAFTEENIKNGFRKAGILPVNPRIILDTLRLETPEHDIPLNDSPRSQTTKSETEAESTPVVPTNQKNP